MPRPPLTPAQRSMRSRIANLARRSQPDYDGRTATQKAREARWQKYEAQVDPEGKLSAEARREKARLAMGADLQRARLKASRAQQETRARKGEAA